MATAARAWRALAYQEGDKLMVLNGRTSSSACGKIRTSLGSEKPSIVPHPFEIVSIPVDQLGPRGGSLSDQGQQIIAALDELFSRARR
jgi:hypothetical protein